MFVLLPDQQRRFIDPLTYHLNNPKPTYEIISEIPKEMYKINTYSRLLNLLNSMLSIQPFEA
jgi:hypothetical protein